MSAIPILLCGKSPTLASAFSSAIRPDYEVIHVCHSLPAALSEIPALLRGEAITPSSNLGANSSPSSSQHIQPPRAIVVGRGFSTSELETMRNKCDPVRSDVLWLVPDDSKMTWGNMAKAAGTGGMGLPGIIAERVKVCLKGHGVVPGMEDEVGGGIWGF